MKSRLLTATAIAVLTVLGAAGTVMAAPFTHGYSSTTGTGNSTTNDAINHVKITIPADSIPFTLTGLAVRCNNDNVTPTANPPMKAAIYTGDGSTILDSTEVITVGHSATLLRVMNFISNYQITSAGDYEIAFWGSIDTGERSRVRFDTTTADTFFVMTSQTYGSAWPTLSDDNAQANNHIICYIIGVKGDAGVVGPLQTDDTKIWSANADKNYGASTIATISSVQKSLFRVMNLDANLGSFDTVDSVRLWIFQSAGFGAGGDADAHQVYKCEWGEGTGGAAGSDPDDGSATWNDWACDANEWGTAGCESASDGASCNTTDAGGTDRTSTALDTQTQSASTSTYIGYWVSGAWSADHDSINVIVQNASGSSLSATVTVSEATGGNWPVWEFFTSTTPNINDTRRRKLIEMNNL